LAVETFDAWMIADHKAMQSACYGCGVQSHHDPETLVGKPGTESHPKDYAIRQLGGREDLATKYAQIARNADIEGLMKACPNGFKPFADEVRANLGPLFGPAESGGAGHA